MRSLSISIFLCLLLAVTGCRDSGGDDSSGMGPSNPGAGTGEFSTDCGVLVNGSLRNPVRQSDGISTSVVGLGSNLVQVNLDSGPAAVKLNGLATLTDVRASIAADLINSFTQGQGTFFESRNGCTTSVNGIQALAGQIVTNDGKSLSEELIKAGVAEVSQDEDCSSNDLFFCYQALSEMQPDFAGTVSNFLWKPQSERNGNLVVLLNPGGATVVVNGEQLVPSGASNGRGTTARANRSGGSFGNNVRVQAFLNGRPLRFPGNSTFFIIENGSQRVQF